MSPRLPNMFADGTCLTISASMVGAKAAYRSLPVHAVFKAANVWQVSGNVGTACALWVILYARVAQHHIELVRLCPAARLGLLDRPAVQMAVLLGHLLKLSV